MLTQISAKNVLVVSLYCELLLCALKNKTLNLNIYYTYFCYNLSWHNKLQGVQEKLCFFTIHYNPSLAYIAVRDFQSLEKTQYLMNTLYIPWYESLCVWGASECLLVAAADSGDSAAFAGDSKEVASKREQTYFS